MFLICRVEDACNEWDTALLMAKDQGSKAVILPRVRATFRSPVRRTGKFRKTT